METNYHHQDLTRDQVDAWTGPALLEFGIDGCPHCRAAQAPLAAALRDLPDLKHVKVEDGPGRPLGRSFRVKLWPTFIFWKDGREQARLVRPLAAEEFHQPLGTLD